MPAKELAMKTTLRTAPDSRHHATALTIAVLAAIISTAIMLFALSARAPQAEGAERGVIAVQETNGKTRTVVSAPNIAVPLLTEPENRTMVGTGRYLPNGMPDLSGMGLFSTYDLLLPGRAVVEDENKLAIPHMVELRMSSSTMMPHDTPIIGEIWDADGDGFADFLGIAFYVEGRISHWKVFRIVGEKLGMRDISFMTFMELYPEDLPET
ncbi:MAG: hypothetical protein A3B29_01205 [Candidatus Sungbacteria bacterium RIFCSPLOWO2_01_FULL_51_34]|nr:MAG: hypothetical protein A3B29_01205 [Candidatus Sungbacteria bacterium RIFCSPLOWO2_01_FULL_51_34]